MVKAMLVSRFFINIHASLRPALSTLLKSHTSGLPEVEDVHKSGLTPFCDPIAEKSCMNVGYLVSFALSGYFEVHHQYHALFIFAGLSSLIALLVVMLNWSILSRCNRVLPVQNNRQSLFATGMVLIIGLFCCVFVFIKFSVINNVFLLAFAIIFMLWSFRSATKNIRIENRIGTFTYLILNIPNLIFWPLYYLSPMILTIFIERNVNRHYLSIVIAPQWVQLIITTTTIIAGPLLCYLFGRLNNRGIIVNTVSKFSAGLILMGVSFLLLPVGIFLSSTGGLVNFNWIIATFTLQGVSELLMAPVSFAIIARLIPHHSQGMMMGNTMLLINMGAIISGYLSTMMFNNYALSFGLLGGVSIFAGAAAFIFIPVLLKKLQVCQF